MLPVDSVLSDFTRCCHFVSRIRLTSRIRLLLGARQPDPSPLVVTLIHALSALFSIINFSPLLHCLHVFIPASAFFYIFLSTSQYHSTYHNQYSLCPFRTLTKFQQACLLYHFQFNFVFLIGNFGTRLLLFRISVPCNLI